MLMLEEALLNLTRDYFDLKFFWIKAKIVNVMNF